jgi:hypothetical protein
MMEYEAFEMVERDGYALAIVPEKLRTHDLCMAAVKQNGTALGYVPYELRAAVEAAIGDGK